MSSVGETVGEIPEWYDCILTTIDYELSPKRG